MNIEYQYCGVQSHFVTTYRLNNDNDVATLLFHFNNILSPENMKGHNVIIFIPSSYALFRHRVFLTRGGSLRIYSQCQVQ